MLDVGIKRETLENVRQRRERLKKEPRLKYLFFELTSRCNERCLHCGSRCTADGEERLSAETYRRILEEVKEDFGENKPMICITGGEPLLRPDFFEIAGYIKELGFSWGMTSNGTLITKDVARRLYETGMKTVSISVDGLENTHDEFRQTKGGFKRTMRGIENLLEVGKFEEVQVTTVVTKKSIKELDGLYELFSGIDIDSWRVIGIEPIGRALLHPELLLDSDDQRTLFEFIRNMRIKGEPVCYGCSHYLGTEYEGEVRDWYYMCLAGLCTASITSTGDITACLDIERRDKFIQGNVLNDRFSAVWKNRFKEFRRDLSDDCEGCRNCPEEKYCHGDAFHSFDFDEKKPRICFKDILF